MDDLDRIGTHVKSLKDDQVVSDACARLIARLCVDMCLKWCPAATAPIIVLATTGAVVDGIEYALKRVIEADLTMPLKPLVALGALPDYLNSRRYGGRTGAVAGWSTLSL